MALLISVVHSGFGQKCGETVWRFDLGESTCKSLSFTIAVAGDSRCLDGFALGCALSGL